MNWGCLLNLLGVLLVVVWGIGMIWAAKFTAQNRVAGRKRLGVILLGPIAWLIVRFGVIVQ